MTAPRRTARHRPLLVIGICAAFGLAGCAAAPAATAPPAPTERPLQVSPDALRCEGRALVFPIPASARACTSVDGSAFFTVEWSAAEVQRFYGDGLSQAGWTREMEDNTVVPVSVWAKGKDKIQVTAQPGGQTTGVAVVLAANVGG